jgi:hypothetical protein
MLGYLFACTSGASAQSQATANQVKAVFLYNFTQFVTWPPQAVQNGPFVIGLLGGDPFGSYLDEVVAGEKVSGQPIVIRRYTNVNEISSCHILFVHQGDPKEVMRQLRGRSILTVGDDERFLSEGGIIRFFIQQNKIRLQINAASARNAQLTISSKLLRLAEVTNK